MFIRRSAKINKLFAKQYKTDRMTKYCSSGGHVEHWKLFTHLFIKTKCVDFYKVPFTNWNNGRTHCFAAACHKYLSNYVIILNFNANRQFAVRNCAINLLRQLTRCEDMTKIKFMQIDRS